MSNSESIALKWTLFIPGINVISSEFNTNDAQNEVRRPMGPSISFILVYFDGEHIVSTLVFIVGMNVDFNQTSISCEIPSLAIDLIDLKTNSDRKLI